MRPKVLLKAAFIQLVGLVLILSACAGPEDGEVANPTTFNATPGLTTVELSWSAVSGATGYTLERQEGSGAFQTIVNAQNKTSHQDGSLKENTSYTYRLKAVKGSVSSSGVSRTVKTVTEGSAINISILTPSWLSKQTTSGNPLDAEDAPANVTVSGTTISMSGSGEAMYYLGGQCTKLTASVTGSGSFSVVADDKQVWTGTGSTGDVDVVGKQNVSLVFQGSGTGTWGDTKVYCQDTPTAPSATSPYITGRWGEVFDWGTGTPSAGYQYGIIVPTHAANLPDGTIATWAAWKETTYGNKPDETPSFQNRTAGFLWNPANNNFTATNNPSHDMFCAGLSVMPDGDVFAAGGGSLGTSSGVDSQRRTSYFDSVTKTWAEVGSSTNLPFSVDHWYGTAVTLPDNRVFVVGGSGGNELSTSAEIRGTSMSSSWTRSTSNLAAMFPTESDINIPNGNTMIGSVTANFAEWAEARGWYPYLNVAPDGQLFQSGPIPSFRKYQVNSNSSINVSPQGEAPAGTAQMRTWGNSIMYDVGKILVTGGSVVRGAGATNSGILLDINGAVQAKAAPPMRFRRAHQNSVVLPTGEVLIIGGNNSGKQFTDGSGFTEPYRSWDPNAPQGTSTNANYRWTTDISTESVFTPELYSPDKNAWRDLADMTVPRNYHSLAILLQDGRVLAAGGGLCGDLGGVVTGVPCNHPNGEIFQPPYLFKPDGSLANRPVIGNLGAGATTNGDGYSSIGYGRQFSVTMNNLGDGSSISKFSMIKLSAVTHSINTDLRYVEYSTEEGNLTGSGSSYQLTTTSNENILTPGYYFLFAINDKGVPSVAKVVQIN